MIAFRCNPGFLPEGEMTATCTNAGIWSPDPAGVDCSYNSEGLLLINTCMLLLKLSEF